MLTDNPGAPLILIVEEENSHAEMIRRSFESSPEEYRLQVVGSLHDAGKAMDIHPPILIVTDCHMPEGDGLNFIGMVNVSCPVIMLTSHGNEQLAVSAMRSGVLDYVVKSVDSFSAMPRIAQRALREWNLIQERKQLEDALHAREQEFRALVENAKDLIFRYDRNCRRTYVNPAVVQLFEKTADALLGRSPEESMVLDPETNALQMQCIRDVLVTGQSMESEISFTASDGQLLHFLSVSVPEWGQNGEVTSVLSIFRNITVRKRAEKLLSQREREFRTLAENSPDCIVRYDLECRHVYVNPAFEKLTGKPATILLGKTPTETHPGSVKSASQIQQTIERVLDEGVSIEIEVTWEESGNEMRCYLTRIVPEFDHEGTLTSVLSNARDISEIRSYQQQLHDLAFYDSLTGLSNRAMFNERLVQSLAESARRGQCMGLMFLGLDHFKIVNDIFGHNVGDRLLRESGERIRNTVRDYDTVARLVGDEFAVILPEMRRAEDLAIVARKILNAFTQPFFVNGEEQFISLSIGITFSPLDGTEILELVQRTNVAMHHAKTQGRNSFQFYSESHTVQVAERLVLENGLRKAVSQGELELYYQPKVTLPTGRPAGAEALLRWNHPELGLVPPDTFIGIAEDIGLIVEIGEWVLRCACITACEWNRGLIMPFRMAVNMSSRQFAANNIVETVRVILEETGCKPEWLEIEITESLLLIDNDNNLRILEALHDMGITLAIDDFGTGFSALSYLTRFPIDTLKIDRSFISHITSNPDCAELVRAIISLASSLRMELVAEGVETSSQAIYLNKFGCALAQGYLFGKPMPLDRFTEWMTEVSSKSLLHYRSFTNDCAGNPIIGAKQVSSSPPSPDLHVKGAKHAKRLLSP